MTRATWILLPSACGLATAFGYGPWEHYRWLMNVRGGATLFFVILALLTVIQQIVSWCTGAVSS